MARPEPTEIPVRRMSIDYPESMGPRFFDDNALMSSLLASLSVAFPPGERFFIDSVRHYLDDIDDPSLRAQIRGFIGQEANHTKEHLAFNEHLERVGYPAMAMQRWVERRIARVKEIGPPEANLARTAALEHFTAILATAMLERPELLDTLHPQAAKLWAWHAIEEIEHRSVAFDVYRAAVDDEALRLKTMRLVTVVFIGIVTARTVLMMGATGALTDVRGNLRGLRLLLGRDGLLRRILPRYLAYYRPDFHPSELDNGAWVERAKRKYL